MRHEVTHENVVVLHSEVESQNLAVAPEEYSRKPQTRFYVYDAVSFPGYLNAF
jgi:hypothetical protein